MKLVICAGTAKVGKTSVLRHAIRKLLDSGLRVAFLKFDVQFAMEDKDFAEEFGIPTLVEYSGDFCPDHASVTTLGKAIEWAAETGADVFLVETAGLCLRCAPYVDGGLGIVVLEETSGIDLPFKIGPMLTLADIAVITKVDMVSPAEVEIFRSRTRAAAPRVMIREVNAQEGIGIDPLVKRIIATPDIEAGLNLRGLPPLGTCTICAGVKKIGREHHSGAVRLFGGETEYDGQ